MTIMEEHHINKERKLEVINNNKNKNKDIARKIKLYCPTVSKLAEILAWDDQRLDLGTIARTFGLEPATLKLNGHFISRGVDLIASSVTWRSLLSFFSSKGLGTGVGSDGALVVHGKLPSCGSKRGHEPAPTEVDNRVRCIELHEGLGHDQATNHEEADSQNVKKMNMSNNASEIDRETLNCGNTGLKRKLLAGNYCPLIKRVRFKETCSNQVSRGREESNYFINKLHCGYQMHDNMKRLREDEAVVASSCKRTR